MGDEQIKKLFAGLHALTKVVEELKTQIESMQEAVNRAARNSDAFISGYHAHGTELARHEQLLDKIRDRCPKLRPETDEFSKVGIKLDGNPEDER